VLCWVRDNNMNTEYAIVSSYYHFSYYQDVTTTYQQWPAENYGNLEILFWMEIKSPWGGEDLL
jgi:hypothetical protein